MSLLVKKYNQPAELFNKGADFIIGFTLIVLSVFLPLAFGTRQPASQQVFISLCSILAVVYCIKLIVNGRGIFPSFFLCVVVVLFLLLILLQIIPLPAMIMKIISPGTYALKTQLLSNPESEKIQWMTLSFYPAATKGNMRILIALAMVFFAAVNYFSGLKRIKAFLTVVTVTGGIVILLALLEKLFSNGKIYWVVPTQWKNFVGPFVNHSHYAQFVNLSIGAAIGLFCISIYETFAGKKITTAFLFEHFFSVAGRDLWILLGVTILGMVTIFMSLSRGGMVSTITASFVVGILILRRYPLKTDGWSMALIALAAFACILFIGFDTIYERFRTLGELDQYNWRLQILKDLKGNFAMFPVWGSGLGTFRVIFPMFQTITTSLCFTHAENEYAQALSETGLTGLSLLIIFGLFVTFAFIKTVRKTNNAANCCVYGLGFGLIAILIHSLSDFGQHVPSNAFLSVVFSAIIVKLASDNKDFVTLGNRKLLTVFLNITVCVIVFCAFGWSSVSINSARIGNNAFSKAVAIEKSLSQNEWAGSKTEYNELISFAKKASEACPDNVVYRHWLNVYRWKKLTNLVDSGNIEPDSIEFDTGLTEIREDLNKAKLSCTTYALTYCFLGRIEKFVLGLDSGDEEIAKAYMLCPNDGIIAFYAGLVDVLDGNYEKSIPQFRQAVEINPGLAQEFAAMFVEELSMPQLAVETAGDNSQWLLVVAEHLEKMEYFDLAKTARGKALVVLEKQCSKSNVSASLLIKLGDIYKSQKRIDDAIGCYQRALDADYAQVKWRYQLASMFAQIGRKDDAIKQAKICLRFKPQFTPARRLIEDISTSSEYLKKKSESLKEI